MKVACPTCGADVEFRYDDSFVRVCDSCRAAVLRTDRGVETLGKLADLTPLDSPLTLFAGGTYEGETFILVGMAQIKHAAGGTWQEWYAKFSGEKWGWLAEAQGKFYLTFERDVPDDQVPRFEACVPGREITLGSTTVTVGERGDAKYLSATGEIPYRLEPDALLRFVDLSNKDGAFATIDFSSVDPTVYAGKQVSLADLGIAGGEVMPARESGKRSGAKLACPNCNGAIELVVPDQAMRVGCPYCQHLIDVEGGNLAILGKLALKANPTLPLGIKGKFVDGELTVIGYMQRSAYADGSWWPFHEYLLYAPKVGYRWLVQSDTHWSYVQPVGVGAIDATKRPLVYEGQSFERFSHVWMRVDAVYGEFYWAVAAGDLNEGEDFIAPPAMISREKSENEMTYSLSTYLTVDELKFIFSDDPKAKDLTLYKPLGVGANQPYPFRGWTAVAYAAFALLFVLGAAKCSSSHGTLATSQRMSVQRATMASTSITPAEVVPSIQFSDPFHLKGGKNVSFTFSSGLSNNWMYVAADLVNEATGEVTSVDTNIEYYSGYEDGESWSEGDQTEEVVIGPVPEGDYVLRLEAQQGGSGDEQLACDIRQGVFRLRWFLFAFLFLAIPFCAIGLHAKAFERKRYSNANPYAVKPS